MSDKEVKEEKMEKEKATEESKPSSDNKESPTEVPTEIKKSTKPKEERLGIAYIYSTFNNTIVHITDLAGSTISRVSGGMVTKHDRLKANPTIAMFVAKKAAERAKDLGITGLYIRNRAKTGSRGLGPGAHAALKALGKEGFRIVSILESTRIPRGGPKKKGGKRGRRV
tara:strand:+ start:161 stop:667 length:507 start_codon:yes stop_codon:yes gene_type:complete